MLKSESGGAPKKRDFGRPLKQDVFMKNSSSVRTANKNKPFKKLRGFFDFFSFRLLPVTSFLFS